RSSGSPRLIRHTRGAADYSTQTRRFRPPAATTLPPPAATTLPPPAATTPLAPPTTGYSRPLTFTIAWPSLTVILLPRGA
ncbi:MAG: hypothetical protein EOP61_02295, partial [Sphingomonadales bacterium]